MTTSIKRGKQSTPARPGILIKQVLSGQRPLYSGNVVSEAAIVDLANTYKQFIAEQNLLRPLKSKLKGMNYNSFVKLFKFSQLLGLVELVREEKMLFPPSNGSLYSIRKGARGGISAIVSVRRIFQLSERGRNDDTSWTDLCRAWREQWEPGKLAEQIVLERPIEEVIEEEIVEAPVEEQEEIISEQTVEGAVPEVPLPAKRKRGRPVGSKGTPRIPTGPLTFTTPTFRLDIIPDKPNLTLMSEHLNEMLTQDMKNKAVRAEIKRLMAVVEGWTNAVVTKLEEVTLRGSPKLFVAYQNLRNLLMGLGEALYDNDIQLAIDTMQKLLKL